MQLKFPKLNQKQLCLMQEQHADRIYLIRKPLKVNTASGATLGPIGIAPFFENTDKQNCTHNFIVGTKLKQQLILGLDFAQRYKMSIDWYINGKLFLRCKGKKIASSLKTNNSGQWMIASLKLSTVKQNETELKIHLITTKTVTIPPHHVSLVQLKVTNQAINTKFPSEALLEIEKNPSYQ